jgi:hypothetical protein
VVAVAVGFVASCDGVVAQLAGVVEGGGEGLDFNLVFGGLLDGVSGLYDIGVGTERE